MTSSFTATLLREFNKLDVTNFWELDFWSRGGAAKGVGEARLVVYSPIRLIRQLSLCLNRTLIELKCTFYSPSSLSLHLPWLNVLFLVSLGIPETTIHHTSQNTLKIANK